MTRPAPTTGKLRHGIARRGIFMLCPMLIAAAHAAAGEAAAQKSADAVQRKVFATAFPLVEHPISEHGAWHHRGAAWAVIRTEAGHALGTQTGRNGYDDSYAYLNGFPPDQHAQATLWLDPTAKGDFREFEVLLRWSDTATTARGYECNLAWNGAYAQIVRWNGRFGDFTYIATQTSFPPGIMPPQSGDILKATIAGDVIRMFLDKHDGRGDRLIVSGRDGSYPDGNPGIGLFVQGSPDPARFGFSQFSAASD